MSSNQVFEDLLRTLQSPVTDFDCGTLCAPGNGGVPVCCHADSIVPVLYKAEYAVLRKRSKLWGPYRPRTKKDEEMVRERRSCDVFAECRGHQYCERENRSLACRTFPFEPYLDHDAELAGLIWYYDLAHLCPLIESKHRIRPRFIRECVSLWDKLFDAIPEERDYYFAASQSIRRSFGQRRRPIPVFTTRGIRRMPTGRS